MRGPLEEVRDVAAGLWLWRTRHPGWRPDFPELEVESWPVGSLL